MIIPLAPILAREFGADGLQVGFLISIYSFVQFLFAPFWGRLSDTFGRKPVFLCGLFGVSLAHIWFAFSDSFTHLFLSRALAGFFGANIVIAMASIADVTSPEKRSKNMGLIGLAFGLGFTFGPVLGFLFILLGKHLGSEPPYGESFAAFGAALLCFLNFIVSGFLLKESLISKKRFSPGNFFLSSFKKSSSFFSRPSFELITKAFQTPTRGKVLFLSFILWLALAQIEPVLILLVQDDFGWDKTSAYWGFAYIGFLMALTQGVLVRKLVPLLGERQINQWGLALVFLGLLLIGSSLSTPPFIPRASLVVLALGVTLFSLGYSLAYTSLSGVLSLLSPKEEQGNIFGVNQSLSSLARILGPMLGGWFYRDLSHSSPFLAAGIMGAGAFALALWTGRDIPNTGQQKKKEEKNKEDISFYSIDKNQLRNLVEKKIPFFFFKLENLPPLKSPEAKFLLEKAEQKTEEEIFSFLKDKVSEQPLVFICKSGSISKQLSKKLQNMGYKNAYYMEKGFQSFLDV